MREVLDDAATSEAESVRMEQMCVREVSQQQEGKDRGREGGKTLRTPQQRRLQTPKQSVETNGGFRNFTRKRNTSSTPASFGVCDSER